jgi:hypothetical protein
MKLITTITFADEGKALRSAAILKNPVHTREGRMKLDDNPTTPKQHDIMVFALTPESVPAMVAFCDGYRWSRLDGFKSVEAA